MRLSQIMISNNLKKKSIDEGVYLQQLMKVKKLQEQEIQKLEKDLDSLRSKYKQTLEKIINYYGSDFKK